ncbi:MAG: glycosyltransferase family 4 protein [Acidobacteria bacterium]|nr:glycosyltransferase family 4 protein [Acidobacteriota bacterium]
MSAGLRVAVLARAVRSIHGQGGLERSVYDLVRHLAARDVDVTLITPPPTGVRREGTTDPFASPRIHVRHVPYLTFPLANRRGTTILDRSTAYPLFGWRAGRVALALARAGAVDVVHAFGASGLGYALGRRRGDPPLVLNPQGLEEFGASAEALPWAKRIGYAPLRAAVRATARHAAAIVATDAALAPVVARHLHPGDGQMVTIPNGIDLVEVSALAGPAEGQLLRQRYGIGSGETVLLSVGRLEHNKGFDVLARALARAARADGPLAAHGWRWILVGAGPYRGAIQSVVDAAGLGGHVILAGRASDADLHAWYEAATVFVHPTRYEGSSLVTLEAMAHRRAVIGTRAGGLPDKIRPGVNGWLVDIDSVDALAEAIDAAARARATLPALGAAGRKIVEDEFSWPVLADRQIALYRDLQSRRP